MIVIYRTQNQKYPLQQYLPVIIYIMQFLTGNLCYIVVINVQELSYQDKMQIEEKKTHIKQYVLLSREIYHVVHCMVDFHMKN